MLRETILRDSGGIVLTGKAAVLKTAAGNRLGVRVPLPPLRRIYGGILLVACLAGCGDASAPKSPTVEGSYRLQRLDGHTLPWAVWASTMGDSLFIDSGRVTIGPDSLWLEVRTSRLKYRPDAHLSDAVSSGSNRAAWWTTGDTVHLQFTDGTSGFAVSAQPSLTVYHTTVLGSVDTAVYERQ